MGSGIGVGVFFRDSFKSPIGNDLFGIDAIPWVDDAPSRCLGGFQGYRSDFTLTLPGGSVGRSPLCPKEVFYIPFFSSRLSSMAERIGVILSGCGVYDGSEIHEAVLTLFFLARQGVEVRCFAPNVDQHHVINHLTGEEMGPPRNVLVESARIARGKVSDLARARAEDLDAVIFPGGFGAAKNLSSFAFKGAEAEVHPEVARIIAEMQGAKKPMGFMCIAPAVCACVLGRMGVAVTIGRDEETAAAINATGAIHVERSVEDLQVDLAHRIASTPAYMYEATLPEIAAGIERLVKQVLAWVRGEA